MLSRDIQKKVDNYLNNSDNKILFIWGPRRSGKTTQLKRIAKQTGARIFNLDLLSDNKYFVADRDILTSLAEENPILLIDEVQNGPGITLALKALFDEFSIKIIATGSSELRQKGEQDFDSLANRYTEQLCLPLSTKEILINTSHTALTRSSTEQAALNHQLIYGSYPEVYTKSTEFDKVNLLENMIDTYILKDIVTIYDLKNVELAKKILTILALQIGNEVSYNEIARTLQANVGTISNYIEILKKNYILIELPSFKTNARRAVSENRKLFFLDLGLRNVLIKDFREIDLRQDKGSVFENYIVSEIFKQKYNQNKLFSLFFYREYGGKEVDLVLENYKKEYICAEIKLSKTKSSSPFPLAHEFVSISKQNAVEKIDQIIDLI